jgi:hypothetical protein
MLLCWLGLGVAVVYGIVTLDAEIDTICGGVTPCDAREQRTALYACSIVFGAFALFLFLFTGLGSPTLTPTPTLTRLGAEGSAGRLRWRWGWGECARGSR